MLNVWLSNGWLIIGDCGLHYAYGDKISYNSLTFGIEFGNRTNAELWRAAGILAHPACQISFAIMEQEMYLKTSFLSM